MTFIVTEMGSHGRVLSRATGLSFGLYSILLAAKWRSKGRTRETGWGDCIGPCERNDKCYEKIELGKCWGVFSNAGGGDVARSSVKPSLRRGHFNKDFR